MRERSPPPGSTSIRLGGRRRLHASLAEAGSVTLQPTLPAFGKQPSKGVARGHTGASLLRSSAPFLVPALMPDPIRGFISLRNSASDEHRRGDGGSIRTAARWEGLVDCGLGCPALILPGPRVKGGPWESRQKGEKSRGRGPPGGSPADSQSLRAGREAGPKRGATDGSCVESGRDAMVVQCARTDIIQNEHFRLSYTSGEGR